MARKQRTTRWRGATVASAAVLVAGLAASGAGDASAATPPGAATAVAQGSNPALSPRAVQGPPTPGSTRLHVSFVMRAQHLAALEREVTAGWRGVFLTPSQFASEYGASPGIVAQLTRYLGSYGITSSVLGGNLDVETTGTAAEYDQALSVGLTNYTVPAAGGRGAQAVHATRTDPKVPAKLAGAILSILGLSNYAPFATSARPASGLHRGAAAAGSGAIPSGDRTPQDFVVDYGLSSVQGSGAHGQGRTAGIVTLAAVDPGVPQAFWTRYLHLPTASDRLTAVDVDGGPGAPNLGGGSDETDLDAEQAGAVADQSQVCIYQAPNSDNGYADALFTAAADNIADSVSASWGESETALQDAQVNGTSSATYAQAFDEAFLQLAAQGQATFVSVGDLGSYDNTPSTTNLTVDTPGDSPYVTSSGGTTLPGTQTYPVLDAAGAPTAATESVTIPAERAWGSDYLWPLYRTVASIDGAPYTSERAAAVAADSGAGGGYSVIEARPGYQQGVSGTSRFNAFPYLTPVAVSSAGGLPEPTGFRYTADPALTAGSAPSGRAEPDLSYDADPQTGYALYDPALQSAYGTSVVKFGGTSFVAPQLNGASAVIESSLGHRVGFWNPVIYAAAKGSTSPFTPLQNTQVFGSKYFFQTSANGTVSGLSGRFANDNLYYAGNPGAVYNPGTGLGVGNLAGIATALGRAGS